MPFLENKQREYEPRLLPHVIDDRGRASSDELFGAIPVSQNIEDGFRDVTYRQLANAINKCAHWFEARIGRSEHRETIAYMGPNDVGYHIIAFGLAKIGYVAFFPSPRNSLEAQLALLDGTNCNIFLLPETVPPPLQTILKNRPSLKTIQLGRITDWIFGETVPECSWNATYESVKYDPFVILHTSGSTGIPKPINITHGLISSGDCYRRFTDRTPSKQTEVLWDACTGKRTLIYAPLFHAAGVFSSILCLHTDWKPVFAPPGLFTADKAAQIIETGAVQIMFTITGILGDMAKSNAHLETLKKVERVVSAGAKMPKEQGDEVVKRTQFINALSATETAIPPCLTNQEDWDYVSFPPEAGVELRPVAGAEEDLFEMFVVRKKELERTQDVFFTFPHLNEYATKDVFSRHPHKPGLWLYEGRQDDIIVFDNGEKHNPVTFEAQVGCHPKVDGCLVIGTGRFEAALIVEPNVAIETADQRETLKNELWPTVQAANEVCVAHGRISRDLVLFTFPGKPLLRTAKGSILRQKNIDAHQNEIDQLYADTGRIDVGETSVNIDTRSKSTLTNSLLQYLRETLNFGSMGLEDNLFEFGLDSLQILRSVRSINRKFKKEVLNSRMVIENPTTQSLANVIWAQLSQSNGVNLEHGGTKPIEQMDVLLKRLAFGLPIAGRDTVSTTDNDIYVAITGTTGSLGCYLLYWLLHDTNVKHIYCLNRAPDARDRQIQQLKAKGMNISLDTTRVSFHQFHAGKPLLGLSSSDYEEMLKQVTHIYHNAWPVNFQLPLRTFIPHMETFRFIIDLSSASLKKSQVILVSSVSAVMQWKENSPVPEEIIENWTVAAPMGYGQSKLVSERLLNEATKTSGTSGTVWRLGQIAGPLSEKGLWNQTEWVPSLIASSQHLQLIPDSLGTMDEIDWVPIDLLAKAMVQSLHVKASQEVSGTRVFHGVNPHVCRWSDLLPSILKSFPSLRVVPYADWFQQLNRSASNVGHVKQNPAIKLLDFFESLLDSRTLPIRSTTKTAHAIPAMADIPAVKGEWMTKWMQQWDAAAKV